MKLALRSIVASILLSVLLVCGASAGSRGSYGPIVWVMGPADSNDSSGMLTTGGAGYDPAIDVTNARCLEYRNGYPNTARHYIQFAQDPLDYNRGSPTGIPVGGIGAGLTFCRDGLLPTTPAGRSIMLVADGVGGTSSSGWLTGGAAPTTKTRVEQALALPGATLGGFIITLGTNDAIGSVDAATFTSNMTTIVTYLRAITGATSTTPVIFVGLVDGWSSGTSTQIRAAIAALPSTIHSSAAVDMTGITGQTGGGTTFHFTAASQRLIGNPGIPNALANLSP